MHKTKNSLPDNTRKAMISLLQARLVDALDLAGQAKQAHWNVKGPSFIALHELFDQIHTETMGQADMLAERLVSIGGQAQGTASVVAGTTGLKPYPLNASRQEDHVEAFSTALADFGTALRDAIKDANESGDDDTADLFTEISRAVDKSLWFVEAHG